MARTALKMQQSARFTLAVKAEIEVMNAMRPDWRAAIWAGHGMCQYVGPFEVSCDQFVEILLARLKHVGPYPGRDARVVYHQIDRPNRFRDARQ